MQTAKMEIYDSTLREGTQHAGISFSDQDRFEIIRELDGFGIDYIELGWPAASESLFSFIRKASKLKLDHTRLVAFGSTKRKGIPASEDFNLKRLVDCGPKYACIFGKSSLEHVRLQLRATPEENLGLIRESVAFLVKNNITVFFDAEHFFDGYKDDPDYALKTLDAAMDGGAGTVVLCDTNGGCLPDEIKGITTKVKEHLETIQEPDSIRKDRVRIGIHCHNDSGCAVANSIAAVQAGATHVQGTINGYGERTGNADLCSVLPNLSLKLGLTLQQDLKDLRGLSHFVSTLANIRPDPRQPYVGSHAFAHKGGVHVDAISKGASYEHIGPEAVGNKREIVLSDVSGKANVMGILKANGFFVDKKDPMLAKMLHKVKEMESAGYDINDLDSEKYLLAQEFFGNSDRFFSIGDWNVCCREEDGEHSECRLSGTIGKKERQVSASIEGGPVEAIFKAQKKLIAERFDEIRDVQLTNYKVMIAKNAGIESTVRVYIEFNENGSGFGTVGVSENILKASFEAIEKGFRYSLLKKAKSIGPKRSPGSSQ